MSSIVIIHSLSRARRFLSTQPRHLFRNGRYLAFPTSTQMVIKFLEDFGIKAFLSGPISKEGRDKFLRDYIDIMDVLADQNGYDLQWWATDLASKNRFTSPLFGLLDALVRCHDAINKVSGQGQLLLLVHPPWPVVLSLENSAKNCEWDLKIISSPISKYLARYRGKVKTWMSVIMGVFSSLFRIWETRRCFGPMHRKKKNRPVYLIKSFVYPGSFSKDGLFHDPFFGKLSEFLERSIGDKVDILTVAVGAENRNKCYQRMKSLKGQRIVPLEAFLRYSDVLKALLHIWWRCITKPFRTVNKLSFLGNEISGLVKECLSSGGWRIKLYQYLHLFAAEQTVRTYRLYACALTFEGNPWERMFVEGLRRNFSEAPIFGYQHAVVPQAAAGVFISLREKKYSPLPSIVLTTGEVPAGIMRHYGMLSKDCIQPSCALRYDYLYNISCREGREQNRFLVLVALDGVQEVLPLLEYVFDQAPKCSNAFFRIRAHPVMPLPELLSRLDRKIDPDGNIETSSGRMVASDVEKSSAVLYWGTTVALEALMMGKPLIHFDRGDLLSYDPLFEFNDFKWTVGKNKDLHTVLEEIRNLSDEKHAVLSEKGRSYISSYFNKVNEKSISKFLPKIH